MQVNKAVLILLLLFIIIKVVITTFIIKDKVFRIVTLVVLIGMFVYSGIGMSLFYIENLSAYIVQFELFTWMFMILMILFSYSRIKFKNISNSMRKLNMSKNLLIFLVCLYFLTYLFPFIYPNFKLWDIFNINVALTNFRVPSFSKRLENKENFLLVLISSQLRLLLQPFFYIFLYRIRKNTLCFLTFYIIPIYLSFVNSWYISRNEILVHIIFIISYFIIEKKLNKKKLVIIVIILIPLVINLFYKMIFIRVGLDYNELSLIESVKRLVEEETNYVLHYNLLAINSDRVTVFQFIVYLLLLPIPNFFINKIIMYNPPEIARILTNLITGLNYGDKNYYLLLPSVLGEGIMIFDENTAFFYSIIVAVLLSLIIKYLQSCDEFKYLLLYFILDVLRQLRGGSQYIFSTWINMLIPFTFFLLLINIRKERNNV